MRTLAIALVASILIGSCKKDTNERMGPCGPEETEIVQGIGIDTGFSDHTFDLHVQGDPYIVGDSLYAIFGFAAAYGGEVQFVRNFSWYRSLPQQIAVKAKFVNGYPPYCESENIVLGGPWDLSQIREMVEGDSMVVIRIDNWPGPDIFVDYTW